MTPSEPPCHECLELHEVIADVRANMRHIFSTLKDIQASIEHLRNAKEDTSARLAALRISVNRLWFVVSIVFGALIGLTLRAIK